MVVGISSGSLEAFLEGTFGSSPGIRVGIAGGEESDEGGGILHIDAGIVHKVINLIISVTLQQSNNVAAFGLFVSEGTRLL